MKALIAGGGIAGPTVALALQRVGLEPVVYEGRDGASESVGLFLGLGVNGMRVLETVGVLDRLMNADVIETPDMVFSSARGKALGTVSNGRLNDRVSSVTLMRGTLQRVLAEECAARGIEVGFGRRASGVVESADGVRLRFEDGSEEAGDILVGADGIRSVVRRWLLPTGVEPAYTGLLNLGGVARGSGLRPTPGRMHMLWGRRAFFGHTVRADGEAWWFANVGESAAPGPGELSAVPTAAWQRRLNDLFAGDPAFVRDLIAATSEIEAFPIHDLAPPARWHSDRVVLVGDAAHAVSPSSGQGASLALEDALTLGKCLRDVAPVADAFARYEALRRPRTEKIVAMGRRRGEYKALGNPVAVVVRDLVMPLVFRLFANEKRMSWIYDYDVDWHRRIGS